MTFYTDEKPIIACSTGTTSNTAIAVIRLSGFRSLAILQPFFSFSLSRAKKRHSHLTNIIFQNRVFDNGLLVFFPEGESYTGENVLELSVHGNQLNVQRILELFIQQGGFRAAHPGEFTYRALKNKKLSLSQVEGLDMLLNANSNLMLAQGLDILQGELHSQYLALYDSFLKLKAAVELSIDFSEDVGEEESKKLFNDSFSLFSRILDSLHSRTQGNISELLSPEVVLVGQTNAGKSSLFNLLVKQNRSIVSDIAGTTRDYISELINIDGTNYKLVDTAGIRESNDVIENIGIDRAFEILKRSFFKILIINPFETNPEYLEKLSGVEFDILLISHSDKSDFTERISLLNLSKIHALFVAAASFKNGSIGPILSNAFSVGPMGPLMNGSIGPGLKTTAPIEPSGSTGPMGPGKSGSIGPNFEKNGPIGPKKENNFGPIGPKYATSSGPIEPLVKGLLAEKFKICTSNNPILLDRHRTCINNLHSKKNDLINKINNIDDVAILSSEVNIFSHYLSELIGILSPDDVLNSIFSNFCIGK
ncbi:MAG: tRNA modification GTPase [Bacteriovorax sp.]